MSSIIYAKESYTIIGICMDIHNNLGTGFLEIVYKDALEYELNLAKISYDREKEYIVHYKDTILPHRFYADFVIMNKIILEVKAVKSIDKTFIAQAINYLSVSNNRLALLVNFGESILNYKRILR